MIIIVRVVLYCYQGIMVQGQKGQEERGLHRNINQHESWSRIVRCEKGKGSRKKNTENLTRWGKTS